MKRFSHLAAALTTSLAVLCHSPAMASGTASTSLSSIQFGVLDLTPDDGIAAGYTINDTKTAGSAYLLSGTGSLYQDFDQPATVRVDQGPSFAESRVGSAFGELATSAAAQPNIGTRGVVTAAAEQTFWLTLLPHTVLTISGQYHVTATQAADGDQAYSAESFLRAGIIGARGVFSDLFLFYPAYPDGPSQHDISDDFLLTYGNGGDDDMAVTVSFFTSSHIHPAVPEVPEPETWLMLNAGLAVLGIAARSRRRQG